jgi:DNA-binding transcriptional LysR family regulator
VLWPVLERFLPNYPEIKVEIVIDYGRTDIVAQRFDAGYDRARRLQAAA